MTIAVVGSYGIGMTMRVAAVPGPGETVSGGSYSAGPGGKGSNQAVAAARLGAEVSLLTAVGDDDFGRAARELWTRECIDVNHLVVGSSATMVGFILVEPDGENRIVIAPGALDELTPAHVEKFRPAIAAAEIVIVSMEIPMNVVVSALRTAREEGTRTLLNPAPAQPLPDDAWALVDLLTPNCTEAPVLLGLSGSPDLTSEDLITRLQDRTGGAVVLTLGSAGCLVHDGTTAAPVRALPARRVVDTTGAGDAFTAALAVALVEGHDLNDAVHWATAAGSHAVTVEGVIDALPRRTDLDHLMGTDS